MSMHQSHMKNHDPDVDVRALVLMFVRRRFVILGMMVIGLLIGSIAVTFMEPVYKARALILLEFENDSAGALSSQELMTRMTGMSFDTSFLVNEEEIIKSRTMARKVVERLNLMHDPIFNPRIQKPSGNAGGSEGSQGNFKNLSLYKEHLKTLPQDLVEQDVEVVVTNFLENLHVKSIAGSYALQIEYGTSDKNKAAFIANGVAETYIEQRLEDKFESTKKLTQWLDSRLKDLREQVRQAEAELEDYKVRYNLTEGSRSAVSAEQMSQLNSQLVLAKARYAEAIARLEQVDMMADDLGSNIEATSEVVNSEMIHRLKIQKTTLEGEISELSKRYGVKHPEMIKRRAELKGLRKTLKRELENIRGTIESDVRFAEARVRALEDGLQTVTGQRHQDNAAMIRLRELEREAISGQLILDTFLQTYKRSDAQEQLQEPDAKIISYAVVPDELAFPNKPLILILSGVVFLFLGLALALILEKMDRTFKSATQLESMAGFPCYSLIPHVGNLSQVQLMRYILSNPSSMVAEAVRTLRTVLNLRFSKSGERPRVVTLTSSFSGEGKSTLSVWLARLAAKSGEKVLLIDGDLRRPTVHKALGNKNQTSLVDYLTGQQALDAVIHKDEETGLHMIYGQSVPNSALDLISTEKMRELIESLKEVYSLILIDSPACLAVSDARVFATMSDQILYIVQWDETPREIVTAGVKQFLDMYYEDIAFVMTNVTVQQQAKQDNSGAGYYYYRYDESAA